MDKVVYEQSPFDGQKPLCDIVMKGGITSGVVYPLTVVELAKKYKLRSIGGTSAGALAAAITAAAEYGRTTGGYQRIADIPNEIAGSLLEKFQPDPNLRPLFSILLTALESENLWGGAKAVVSGYPGQTLLAALPGLLIAVLNFAMGWTVVGLMLAILAPIVVLALRLIRAVTEELPKANYGLCSGKTVEGASHPALTDWLADTIDRVAGIPLGAKGYERPLTFGDLRACPGGHEVELAMITTDLSMRRPYRLPFRDNIHFFSKSEFEKLFPARILEHMLSHTNPLPDESNITGDLYYLPKPDDLPIVVAARMSLSFPGLIQAVPLYKCDYTMIEEEDRNRPRKCLFSDGGLSSNFPIHFFDSLWPNRPTFAIALDGYTKEHHGNRPRVHMAQSASQGRLLPIREIKGLPGFLMTLLDAAKDWQDNLLSTLPGYRERIVRIALKDDEGGLNLNMSPEIIARLTKYGKCAGLEITGDTFSMDEHRWRRFLIAMSELEEMLDGLALDYDPQKSGAEAFGAFLDRFDFQGSYAPQSEAWKEETLRRASELVALGRRWRDKPMIRSGRIPTAECVLRVTPKE